MIDCETLRKRIGQEFDGECHLTADEAHSLIDVYEAACAWRADRAEVAGALLTRDYGAADRLAAVIDAARSAP